MELNISIKEKQYEEIPNMIKKLKIRKKGLLNDRKFKKIVHNTIQERGL